MPSMKRRAFAPGRVHQRPAGTSAVTHTCALRGSVKMSTDGSDPVSVEVRCKADHVAQQIRDRMFSKRACRFIMSPVHRYSSKSGYVGQSDLTERIIGDRPRKPLARHRRYGRARFASGLAMSSYTAPWGTTGKSRYQQSFDKYQ